MLSIKETAKELNLTEASVKTYLYTPKRLEKIVVNGTTYITKQSIENYKEKRSKEYAVYKGDDFIDMGTAKELAERLGVKESTIRWYNSPSAQQRAGKNAITAVRI